MAEQSSEVILSWNATNWITILLMVSIGFVLLGVITRIVQQKRAVGGS